MRVKGSIGKLGLGEFRTKAMSMGGYMANTDERHSNKRLLAEEKQGSK